MTKPTGYPQGEIWERFYEISQVPRPSKSEEKIREYLLSFAKTHKLNSTVDKIGNVYIYVDATKGYEEHETVIIQNHMDMVPEADADRDMDFENDPIKLLMNNGWLTADRTTLGADNGIGCAAALAILTTENRKHPALELLFTVDEETGLNGALNLDSSLLKGKKLLNLDTEEWGSLYIGCAGGLDYHLRGMVYHKETNPEFFSLSITLSGLAGGHSGLDIHRSRGNALTLLGSLLTDLPIDFDLQNVSGGVRHNVIPYEATAVISCLKSEVHKLEIYLEEKVNSFISFLPSEDHGVTFKLSDGDSQLKTLSDESKSYLIDFINLFPHGAFSYNWSVEPAWVNVSCNFASLNISTDGHLTAQSSGRFFEQKEMDLLSSKFKSLARSFNLSLESEGGYPSWKPVEKNSLLDLVKDVYRNRYEKNASVKAIHAGLECGIIKECLGEMDVVSFGPNITGAHSSRESLEVSSTDKFYTLLIDLLEKL